ncbi:pre-B lymphocyte protein 3 [Alligator mississippiensis]|uniref:Pre-B lymphocyte protein 3 n=1 Tax=Alligator mississippiensis TaxID=8496 RepID=A0A151N485_ALLMI|nr:pre-B lymphocyte protein 3 [Alligator mississippiensis]KYO31602.1 pre-B lymphocyte protein 3 [Alligator mississippiensis]
MVLCILALLLAGVLVSASRSQPVLTQPDFILVSPGQTVNLSCSLNSGYHIKDYGVSWYQQRPGYPPRYLLYYNSEADKHKSSEIPDRFSAFKDPTINACILTISGVEAEDGADYYCSISYAIYYL